MLSNRLKGTVPMNIANSLNQNIVRNYLKEKKDVVLGNRSLRNYKNTIPLPFSAKSIVNLHWDENDKRFYFTLFGIPFATFLGRDRSNNKAVLEQCLNNEYKICGSAIIIGKDNNNKQKITLCLSLDVPILKKESIENNILFAKLDVETPIIANFGKNTYTIGSKDEFLHRRLQIQDAHKRAKIAAKYNISGKGRKKKLHSLEKYEKMEYNYVQTKTHTYARHLVDLAESLKCAKIVLLGAEVLEKAKIEQREGNDFILRNWTYYGLKNKIEYKAKMLGIQVEEQDTNIIKKQNTQI